jgi:hypothetical protein
MQLLQAKLTTILDSLLPLRNEQLWFVEYPGFHIGFGLFSISYCKYWSYTY